MGVVSVRTLGQPARKVKILGLVERDRVAVEQVQHNSGIALFGEEIGHDLAVLPDANDVGDVENSMASFGFALGRSGDVGVDFVVDFGEFACGLAAVGIVSYHESNGW